MADLFVDHVFEPLLAQKPTSSFGGRRGKCPVSPLAKPRVGTSEDERRDRG